MIDAGRSPARTTADLAAVLTGARRRTLDLLAPLDDDALTRQHSALVSPLVWDLAHIGHFEELWLLRRAAGEAPFDETFDDLYDAFRHARAERAALPILSPAQARGYIDSVRTRTLAALERLDFDRDDPLLASGFVVGFVAQHELQHQETMLSSLQLREEPYAAPPARPRAFDAAGETGFTGVGVTIGSDDAWAYDNERPVHQVDLAPFRIDAAPVTNARFAEFVSAGGYDDTVWWSDAGWSWRQETGAEHPQFWRREGHGTWSRLWFGHREELPPDEPVQHVCWHEAEAYARWAGKRLSTELEWEAAARAPGGIAATTGAVWEWTASDFRPYPGFLAFPYPEYSKVFFGREYRVLRGASFATAPLVARPTFRNWDYPVRRQIFAGFRCAADA